MCAPEFSDNHICNLFSKKTEIGVKAQTALKNNK